MVQKTIEMLQLQYIDKVIDVCCAGPASSSAICEETVEIRQLQLVEFWTRLLHARCVQRQVPWWSMSWRSSSTVMDVPVILQRRRVATVEVPQIQFIAGVSGNHISQQRWVVGSQQWRLWRR